MKYTHSLVAETAREMANELYELAAKDNDFYRQWPNRRAFVRAWSKHLTLQAFESLVQMLAQPDDRVAPALKERVYEAVLAHRTLNPRNDPGNVTQIVH